MAIIFIAGSIAISRLHADVARRIEGAAAKGHHFVVGDAAGVDLSVQRLLHAAGVRHVRIFCAGAMPRNNVGDWPVETICSDAAPGSRAFFTAKDRAMAEVADYGLMVWDARSTGTLTNVIELLARARTSIVFVNKVATFVSVSDAAGLDRLVAAMTPAALAKAEQKMALTRRIAALRDDQLAMPL